MEEKNVEVCRNFLKFSAVWVSAMTWSTVGPPVFPSQPFSCGFVDVLGTVVLKAVLQRASAVRSRNITVPSQYFNTLRFAVDAVTSRSWSPAATKWTEPDRLSGVLLWFAQPHCSLQTDISTSDLEALWFVQNKLPTSQSSRQNF